MIKTRFAPSPTGELHIGSVRTALFAYLFARHNNGEFLLRIEDTDRERYVEGSVERIISSLKWLGIDHDNKDIMVQSNRLDVYKKAAFDLVKAGKAYVCTCSKEKLAADRELQEKNGQPPKYAGHCRNSNIDIENLSGEYVVRMKMPESGKLKFDDIVRGEVEFDLSLLDDQVILKSDGFPTYHLASIVDDHEMAITHVIRAEEWLSSTPKHLILYEMFGWEPPKFAHLSMILGTDKKKLSKRHGATSALEYRNEGYLPDALVNYISFLGWNPKTEQEIFNMNELISAFKLENVNKAPAIFDTVKLQDVNEKYIKSEIDNLSNRIQSILKEDFNLSITDNELGLIGRGGFATLKNIAKYIEKLRVDPEYDASLLVFKKSTKEASLKGLQSALIKLSSLAGDDWNEQSIQSLLSSVVSEESLTNGDLFWPVRVSLSGEEKSPSPVELALALGKEETIKRIEKAVNKLLTE